ncbi:HDOD domain-containing protein [Spiribacter halobius]|uniref:HDOD domain-containing protein n=1 Tax=Sediminicurvatus halobius TaxID=2182432 RepID=A0A2U2N0A1_9GAMM|nr:HDOD domain-containing protein [Spiribacter halobius]PWG62384.1 hypothetical protein DEM34_12220 [Spiribacter halobius]UEX79482.1 HDOD domain-containing protein [Spiribacter halobius]
MSDAPPLAPDGLDDWLRRLQREDLPVLGDTVQALCNTAQDHGSSATDLARVILRDAALTSDVIRIANSAYFNPAGVRISTVSRAVIVLGFDTVRAIGLSLTVIDTLVRGDQHSRVRRVFRSSLHAAVQARALAEATGDPAPEEVLIAALLYRIGELAFWSLADDATAAGLETALAEGAGSPADIERDTLGFALRELSRALARDWRLGDLLTGALRPGAPRDGRARLTRNAHAVVADLEAGRLEAATNRVAREARLEPVEAGALIERATAALPELGRALGVDVGARTDAARPERLAEPTRQPDPALQLRVLREMSATAHESRDLQALFDLAVEGLYRGQALDRCALAALRRDRRGLAIRAALGVPAALYGALERVSLEPGSALAGLLAEGRPARLEDPRRRQVMAEAAAQLGPVVFVAPLQLRGRTIGVLLAEPGAASGEALREAFDGFCHLAEQTMLCLGRLTA